MTQYIDKSAVVAEIKRLISIANSQYDLVDNEDIRNRILWSQQASVCSQILSFLDTLETVDVGVDFNTFDDEFKAEAEKLGIDPDSELCKSIKDDLYATAIEYYKENRHEKN